MPQTEAIPDITETLYRYLLSNPLRSVRREDLYSASGTNDLTDFGLALDALLTDGRAAPDGTGRYRLARGKS